MTLPPRDVPVRNTGGIVKMHHAARFMSERSVRREGGVDGEDRTERERGG